jgi:hypothetical protein
MAGAPTTTYPAPPGLLGEGGAYVLRRADVERLARDGWSGRRPP